MKNLFKGTFTKKKKKKIVEKNVIVKNDDNDKCLCERNHGDEVITCFCFKHHTEWL